MQTEIRKTAPDGPEKMAQTMVPAGRLGDPTELAQVIAFMLSDEASYVNGSIYVVGMYFSRRRLGWMKSVKSTC